MQRIEYRSAAATCIRLPESRAGILLISFYGLLDDVSMLWLVRRMLDATRCVPAMVVRTDQAAIAMTEFPLLDPDEQPSLPAALVMRRELREMGVEYGRRLAERGITRAVFVESQLEMAIRWAARRAVVAPA